MALTITAPKTTRESVIFCNPTANAPAEIKSQPIGLLI
jgi:hypothetical protein